MAVAPLNLPGYATPQSLDFSSLANLGQVYKKAQDDALVKDTLANLGQGGQVDGTALLRSGNLTLAQLGQNMLTRQQEQERQARQDQRQTGRDAVDDRFREESLRLQKAAAARAGEDKPIIKDATDANGNTVFYRINPRTGEASALSPTGAPAASGGNPFGGGKFNEGQGKAAGFTDRMLQSEGVLTGIDGSGGVQDQGTGFAGVVGGTLNSAGSLPVVGGAAGALANKLKPAARQQFEQAKRDFVNAQLRRESGAAISPSEFDSADKQYFPSVGDSPEVIAQKSANRRAAIQAMGREGGPSYRPKYNFDDGGKVVGYGPQGAKPQAAAPAAPQQPQAQPRQAPDGNMYVPDPARPGKYLMVQP